MNTALTVCHLSTMSGWGGVERLIEDVLTYPSQTDVRHLLLATSWSPEVIESIRQTEAPTFLMERRSRLDVHAIRQAAAWLSHNQVQVIHSYNAFANIWGRLLSTLARIPIFITGEHGTIWRTDGRLFQLDRIAQRTASTIVANSRASAGLLEQRYGIDRKRIHIIANAVAPLPVVDRVSLRRSLGLEDSFVVGSIGRLDNPKHYHTLIDAAVPALATKKELRFLLIGGGPLEGELRARVDELGIADRFTMTGFRPDARRLIQALDLFVGTSIRESFGNVFVEAALAKLPVIAPAVDGIPEVVIHDQTGWLLTPRAPIRVSHAPGATPIHDHALINGRLSAPRSLEPAELAEAILQLMGNPDKRAQFGMEARRRAELQYSLERYIMASTSLYRDLATTSSHS